MVTLLENAQQLVNTISDEVQFVLLGENTHGSEEFYKMRSEMTKILVEKRGFRVVLVEGDWPPFYRINKYITSEKSMDNTAKESMEGIKNYPLWMWRNGIIAELIEWLRKFNLENEKRKDLVYMLGMDTYSLLESKRWVCAFLDKVDPEYSDIIKKQLSFLDEYNSEKEYAKDVVYGKLKQYSQQIQDLYQNILSKIQWEKMDKYFKKCPELGIDKFAVISCEQSLEVMINADEYFRKLYLEPPGSNASWNTRDQHFSMTIMRMHEQLKNISHNGERSKIVVWAHNSHVGSSLASERGGQNFEKNDQWNLGQMIRSIYGENKSKIFGFYTHHGTVTASPEWGVPCQTYELNPALDESYEGQFHKLGIKQFFIDFNKNTPDFLSEPRLQRWIGVSYVKDNELKSHYGKTKILEQYDCVVYIDKTTALEPFDDGIANRI